MKGEVIKVDFISETVEVNAECKKCIRYKKGKWNCKGRWEPLIPCMWFEKMNRKVKTK